MVAEGHEVSELGNTFTTRRYDVAHLHWIDAWNRPYDWLKKYPYQISAAVMFLLQYCQLLVLKLLRCKIVWTMHNLYPHDSKHLKVDRILTLLSISLFDGWISLTESAKQLGIEEFPALASKPSHVSLHAHYRSQYPPALDKRSARAKLGLEEKETVILYFGWIRPYKGVDLLMKTFSRLQDSRASLIVAGASLPKTLAFFLQKLADADDRILYMPESQSPESVATLFSAADLAVFPYRAFLNSGAAILSLTFDVPCLVRGTPTMIDLQRAVGAQWVNLFDDEISVQSLEESIVWSKKSRNPETPDLTMFEPELISRNTVRFYERICTGS